MRFLGNIESKTDAKGRVFLPASFRKLLEKEESEELVLRKDIHQPCLVLYPKSSWDRRSSALLEQVNEFDDESQMVFRMFVSEAEELKPDSMGRILIPRRYLQMADIVQTVRFIGMNDTIEIWAAEKTEKPFLSQEDFAAKMKAMMAKKG
mgnify:CR=1 FL=1